MYDICTYLHVHHGRVLIRFRRHMDTLPTYRMSYTVMNMYIRLSYEL